MTGRIFDIQKFSLEDGAGIRTTVFFKGCPLRCAWCSNPESQRRGVQRMFWRNKCIGCDRCAAACRKHGGRETPGWTQCGADCQKCVNACPAAALCTMGGEYEVDALLDILLTDSRFFRRSGGGVTFSGGEATLQWRFMDAVAARLRGMLIHTAAETCGFAPWEHFRKALRNVDLVLYDIKQMDDALHQKYTGRSNVPILENLRRLAGCGKDIVIRIPLIAGYNDDPEHMDRVIALAGECGAKGIELLPYHNWGKPKYAGLGLPPPPGTFRPPDPEWTETLRRRIAARMPG